LASVPLWDSSWAVVIDPGSMNPAPSLTEVAAASKSAAHRVFALGENLLELLLVEVKEARERLLQAIVLALGMAVFGLLTGIAFTIGVVLLFWDRSPLTAVAILGASYAVVAALLYVRLHHLNRRWEPFPEILEQVRKDCKCLASELQ